MKNRKRLQCYATLIIFSVVGLLVSTVCTIGSMPIVKLWLTVLFTGHTNGISFKNTTDMLLIDIRFLISMTVFLTLTLIFLHRHNAIAFRKD